MAKKSSGASAAQDLAQVAASGRQGKLGGDGEETTSKSASKVPNRRILFTFTSLVILLIVLGVSFVFFARTNRNVSAAPVQSKDHWHSAYSVWDCASGATLPPFQSTRDDVGIHSHGDGVLHIHPWFDRASGRNARLEHFFTAMNVQVTKEAIILDNGTILEAGVECNGEPSVITVHRWRDINNLDRKAVIYDDDFGDIQIINDGEAFVIAREAPGTDVEPPPLAHVTAVFDSSPLLLSRPPVDAEGNSTTTSSN